MSYEYIIFASLWYNKITYHVHMKQTTTLIILDGFGISNTGMGDATQKASMPFYHSLLEHYPHTSLKASGEAVGLPVGLMGNSEVGHLTIGAGRVLKQSLVRINDTIADRSFFSNDAFLKAIQHAKQHNSVMHLMGLLSDGGVHSHINHLFALIDLCNEHQVETRIHAFLDGRDVPPKSAKQYLDSLNQKIGNTANIQLSTLAGRYYAMDRDHRWDRVEKAYKTLIGKGKEQFVSYQEALDYYYGENITDEFIPPCAIDDSGDHPYVHDNDAIIFFNFRTDRPKELSMAFLDSSFKEFPRDKRHNLYFVSMTEYAPEIPVSAIAFPKEVPNNTLPQWLAKHHKTQFHTAETEKYAHVTFFFNGGVEQSVEGEERKLIPSPKVNTYDLKPEMSAIAVKEEVIHALESENYDFIVVNFANPDMVGHTGKMEATIQGLEIIDTCLKEIVSNIQSQRGQAFITADHGNCEEMLLPDGSPSTAHSTNLVPGILISPKECTLHSQGSLADVAPTILALMGLDQPTEMHGKSLITS